MLRCLSHVLGYLCCFFSLCSGGITSAVRLLHSRLLISVMHFLQFGCVVDLKSMSCWGNSRFLTRSLYLPSLVAVHALHIVQFGLQRVGVLLAGKAVLGLQRQRAVEVVAAQPSDPISSRRFRLAS